jgi:predicted metal-dependent hydrolase
MGPDRHPASLVPDIMPSAGRESQIPGSGTIVAMVTAGAIETRQLDLPRGPIVYGLRRSARSRTLRVTIDPERGVVVSVPLAGRHRGSGPEQQVERFLIEREDWIRRHLDRQAAQRAEIVARGGIADGATFRYLGELHRLRVLAAPPRQRRSTVERLGGVGGDELVVHLADGDRRQPPAVLEAWLRARARTAVDRAVATHAPALGVSPARITIRDARTRWGSASRRRALSFSWRLILAPPPALETVVIHELSHLRVFGHGPAFWAHVAARRPDHASWRRWLRAHALELHAAI